MMTTTLLAPSAAPRALPAVAHRITFGQTVAHSLTMAYRGIVKLRHNPEQLLDVTLQPILFTVMFTYIFGGAISGDVKSYLPVIIPGILVQTILLGSMVTGTQLREDMDKGVFDRFKSLPIARIAALAGGLLANTVRFLIATTLTIVMGLIMGYRPEGGVTGVLGAAILVIVCAFAVSWIFAFFGVIGRSAAAVGGYSIMVMFPLTFLSSAFVPVSSMPGWLQAFVKINPITNLVYAARDLMNENYIGAHFGWSIVGAAAILVVFVPITLKAYGRKA